MCATVAPDSGGIWEKFSACTAAGFDLVSEFDYFNPFNDSVLSLSFSMGENYDSTGGLCEGR